MFAERATSDVDPQVVLRAGSVLLPAAVPQQIPQTAGAVRPYPRGAPQHYVLPVRRESDARWAVPVRVGIHGGSLRSRGASHLCHTSGCGCSLHDTFVPHLRFLTMRYICVATLRTVLHYVLHLWHACGCGLQIDTAQTSSDEPHP
jgi:hypothetical protein